MGKQSIRENKTIYQLCREAAGLTRAEASEKMNAVSASKIEKFEYETQEPTLYDILQMADAYKRPDLCNYYCSHKCEIGYRYVPEVEVTNLSNIILETIASVNYSVTELPEHLKKGGIPPFFRVHPWHHYCLLFRAIQLLLLFPVFSVRLRTVLLHCPL